MNRELGLHYDRLAAQERAAATIAALARADDEEVNRLGRACPRLRYEQLDAAFLDRMSAAEFVTTVFALDIGRLLSNLALVHAMRSYTAIVLDDCLSALFLESLRAFREGARWGWTRAGRDDPPPIPAESEDDSECDVEDKDFRQLDETDTAQVDAAIASALGNLDEIASSTAVHARSMLDGFSKWAENEGFDPSALLGAFAGYLHEQLNSVGPDLDAAVPEPDVLDEYMQACAVHWARRSR